MLFLSVLHILLILNTRSSSAQTAKIALTLLAHWNIFINSTLTAKLVLCCLSLGVHLALISLSLPYPHPIILFISQITLCFHLFWIPWSPCDPLASLLPCVLLLTLIFLRSSLYSSCLIVPLCTINHPSPINSLTRLLIPLCLVFSLCIVDQYRLPVTLYKPQ